MNSTLKHIFFDLDHTLWDFDKNSALSFRYIFQKEKLAIDLQQFLEAYRPINDAYWKLYRANKIGKESLRFNRLADTFRTIRINYTDTLIHHLARDYIKHLPDHNYLMPGAEDCLVYLQSKYRLHIITNGFEEVQHLKLRNSHIQTYFTSVTTSEEAGVKKPGSLIFKKALDKAHAYAQDSIMIGDNLEADIFGAHRVGMRSIYYNSRNEPHNYTGTQVQNISELKQLL